MTVPVHTTPEADNPRATEARFARRPSALLNSIVLVIAILFGCIAMEVALRVIFAHSLDFSITEMWKYAVKTEAPSQCESQILSFAQRAPNRSAFLMGVPVSINSEGLRDR